MSKRTILCASLLVIGLVAPSFGQQVGPQSDVALTVYNNNFGVVKEVRPIDLKSGVTTVRFADVAKRIDATSVHFTSLTAPATTTVLEQNYEYDLVSADKLLTKYIDQPIAIVTEDARYAGTLLSYDGGQLVIQGQDQLYMVQRPDNVQSISFAKLPEGLLTRPTLVWQVNATQAGKHRCQVAYQTSGLSWSADYNAVINADDTELDLGGWVTINNQSGATYKDAQIKLIAGDVRKVQPEPAPRAMMMRADVRMAEARNGGGFQEQSFFEYHLYTLGRRSTVNENQVKQIELLTAARVPVTKRYIFEPGGRYWHRRYGDKDEYKVNVFIELKNDEKSNLGMPLPKGKVRVYKKAKADARADGKTGDLEFIGEDQIDHTPRDEDVKLYIGDAFDIVGEKKIAAQTQGKQWRQQKIRIELRNHKDEQATIRVREHMGHGNWTISDNSHPFHKDDAKTIEFDIPVDAHGKGVLTYTVDYNW